MANSLKTKLFAVQDVEFGLVWRQPDAALFCLSLESSSLDFPSQFLALDFALYQKTKVYTDKKKIKFSSFIRKFRMMQLQSHILGRAS